MKDYPHSISVDGYFAAHKWPASAFPLLGNVGQRIDRDCHVVANDGYRREISTPWGVKLDLVETAA